MKKQLTAALLVLTMTATSMPYHLQTVQAENGAAYEESPEMEIRETKELPEASEAAENIDSIYESIDLKKAKKQEFGTKTLILGTKDAEIDPKGAIEKIPVGGDVFALVYDSAEAAEAAYEAYAGMEGIDFVEPDHVVEIEDTDNTETGLPGETAPKSTEAESSTEAMPKAAETESPKETEPENTQTGLSEETAQTAVCIAVIDTGICPDAGLAGAYLENSEAAADDNGHGTQVAGLIAGSLAQAGITPEQAGLLAVKVADADGRCTVLQLYLGIRLAMEAGADVLHISLGTKNMAESALLGQILQEAYDTGTTVVTSAGNDSADVSGYSPANIPSVITVGSVGQNKEQSGFSNYGQTLDCVSYGEGLTVTGLSGEETAESGTSYAAALVTAELAVQMASGALHGPEEADAFVKDHAEDLGVPGWDEAYGYGLLGTYAYQGEQETGTETGEPEATEEAETEDPAVPEEEEPADVPVLSSAYLQRVNTYNLLVGDIGLLASNGNLASTRLLADAMKESIRELFSDGTDISPAFNGEPDISAIAAKAYDGTGNEAIDSAARELEKSLKEGVLASGKETAEEWETRREEAEEKLEEFVAFLAGYQESAPLERDVYIEASTTKTVSDAATLQSIAQTAGDYTVKLSKNITLTSEIVVTNGCTLRLQSNAKDTRRSIKLGSLAESAKTSGMCMFRVDGLKKNRLILGTKSGDYPVTLDGDKQAHNGFLVYNAPWVGNADAYQCITTIYPGTVLKNNVMYFDSTSAVNGASGSAICNYGTLYIKGGTIKDNGFLGKAGAKVGEGAGIANYNKFYMSGGEITGNVATNGNGILTGKMGNVPSLSETFEVKITGGSIHDNGNAEDKKYTSNGGGILVNPNTPVTIGGSSTDDVKIYGNMADYGGGIANYGVCNLGKCKIYGNYSQSEGGGILNRARANTAAVPQLHINGAYVYQNYCSKANSSYAGGIASLKRTVSGKDIVPKITIASGYFYDNDGFSIHIDSGTLSFGAGARFGFSSYSSATSYKVTEEWYGSGVSNTGGTVNITGNARMFVPEGAIGIKNTGTLNISDGADFAVFCKEADCAIENTGRFSCGKVTKDSSGTVLYPYTVDGSADYGIKNTGSGTAYLTGRIRGNYKVGNTAKSADTSAENRNIQTGIYNTSAASYSTANPYAVILQGTTIDGKAYTGYVGYAQTGILNNTASGSVSIKQGEIAYSSGSGLSNKGLAYLQDADAKLHDNGKDGIYNYKGASLTISSAGSIFCNGSRGIYNGGTAQISAGAKIYGNTGNGVTNGEEAALTVSGATDISQNGGNGVSNSGAMTISGAAKLHGNTGHGLVNSGTTMLSGNTDIYGNGKAGISNGAGCRLTITKGTIRENAAGGVANSGTFALNGGSVTKNNGTAGIQNKAGAGFTMSGGSISANAGAGIRNAASATVNLNGGLLYGNLGYGVQNLGICSLNGIKIGFSSFTSTASYVTSGNSSGGIHNQGTLQLKNGGYVNGGSAPAIVNAGEMDVDAGAAAVLLSISGETVLSNSGKLDTAYAAGKTSMWVLGGSCKYGIKNTGSMKFCGKADGRYRVTLTGYQYQETNRGFTEAAIYNSSTGTFDSSSPYAAYLFGDASLIGSAKDGLRTDKGTCRMEAAYTALNKTGVNVGSNATLQLSSADARIYANGTGIYNNGTVNMANGNIYSNTGHGVYQDGTFTMSGAAQVNTNNDVCLPVGRVITVNGALTTNGVVAKVTPLDEDGEAIPRITTKESEDAGKIGRVIVKTSYAGSKGSNALFYQEAGFRFVLSNEGILRPGDYMDREMLAKEKHTEISDKDIVISNKYVVSYEKNIDEKDENGNPVEVAVNNLPVNQDKFWCENLQLPNKEGTYTNPSVSTEPYASYYRFLNWNEKADGTGNAVILPMVYQENEDMTIYALWQKNFNVAYIGNEQSAGEDFTETDISQDSTYTFDDNGEMDGTEHFTKDIENSYIDQETGEEVKQETTAKVVQWSLKNTDEIGDNNYNLSSDVLAGQLYKDAEQVEGAITNGTPNADYGLYPQFGQLQTNTVDTYRGNSPFAMSGSSAFVQNLFASSPVGQPYVNLYAVWDEGPLIEAYDTYYSLEEAQGDENGTKITMEALLSEAAVTDKEDTNAVAVTEMPEESGWARDTTFYTIIDYSESDFTNFHHDGSVTVTYKAVDSVGNVARKRITVHIVDTSGTEIKSHRHDVRFISRKYLDTLEADSIWNTNPEYHAELMEVLDNERVNMERTEDIPIFGDLFEQDVPGSGEWKIKPQETWRFTRAQIKEIQEYIDANGFGKTEHEDALRRFRKTFASCKQ